MTKNHIDPPRFKANLAPEELEHLLSCRCCRESFADYIQQNELLSAPPDLRESILARSRNLDVQLIAGTNRLSKRLLLFYFSLKVGAAVLCAIALLILAPGFTSRVEERAMHSAWEGQRAAPRLEYYEKVNQLTETLHKLSIQNMEVFNYDKKER